MSPATRMLLALAIVVTDAVAIAVPLTALAAAYVLIVRPLRFKAWVDRLYQR